MDVVAVVDIYSLFFPDSVSVPTGFYFVVSVPCPPSVDVCCWWDSPGVNIIFHLVAGQRAVHFDCFQNIGAAI
jgi:hypothetical protein